MILYLIRRQVGWKTLLGSSLGCALAFLIRPWYPGAAFFGGLFAFSCLWVVDIRRERCTPFEAALPVSGRQILAARLLSSALVVWLPVLTVGAAIAVVGRGSDRGLLTLIIEAASILTTAQLTVQSLGIREFAPPRWAAPTVLFAGLLAFLFTVDRISTSWVLLACALASGALLGTMWRTVPKSFQAVPLRVISADRRVRRLPRRWIWLPVAKTLFPKNVDVLVLVANLGIVGLTNSGWALSVPIVVLLFAGRLSQNYWLFTLPLSRHKVFLGVIGSTLGLFLAANLLRMGWLGFQPRIVITNLAVQAATSLLGIFAVELLLFRAHARRASRGLLTVPALLWMILYICMLVQGGARSSELVAVKWLTQILPGSLALGTLAVSVVLGVLYWVASRVFSLIEIPGPPLRRNSG